MTKTQRATLRTIRTLTRRYGYPPTMREIARARGVASQAGCREILKRLARDGWVELTPMVSRGIRLTQKGMKA